jgi:hypothetical protein
MGKSQPQTQSTDTSTQIPQWLESAGERAVSRGETLSNRAYDPWQGGPYVAPQTQDTYQSYQQVRDLQGRGDPAFDASMGAYRGLVGQAAPITAGGVNQNTNQLFGNFQQGALAQAQGLLSPYLNGGPATAQQVGANATALMSPYQRQVIDPTLAAGEQARQIARQTIGANAANLNAFGGSRQGVVEGVSDAQNALGTQQQIGQMLQQGWGKALDSGTSIGLQAGKQGYDASSLIANLGATGYDRAAQQGQGITNTNLASGLTAAGALPNVAGAWQGYGQKDASLLQAAGAADQNWVQQNINAAMGEDYQRQNWDVQNLDLFLGALGGVPYSTSGTGSSTRTLNKNVAGSALGGALSGAATGAMLGSVVPGIGNVAGAIGGGAIGLLGGLS